MQPIEQALEAALIVMRNGGSTDAADRTFANILKGNGGTAATSIWRLDFIAASGTEAGQSTTHMRSVGPIGVNLVRVGEIVEFGKNVAKGKVPAATIDAELARIKGLPSPYNRWLLIAAAAIAAASFSRLLGGDQGSLVITAIAAAVGQFFRPVLSGKGLAVATVTLIAALISASIATLGVRLGYTHGSPATVISSVIYMVPGLPLINGFLDMVSHKYLLAGVERIANAIFLFLVLVVAVVLALTAIL
jgi:uncharacterized membrane protein YjjP (DUF1212 family)